MIHASGVQFRDCMHVGSSPAKTKFANPVMTSRTIEQTDSTQGDSNLAILCLYDHRRECLHLRSQTTSACVVDRFNTAGTTQGSMLEQARNLLAADTVN